MQFAIPRPIKFLSQETVNVNAQISKFLEKKIIVDTSHEDGEFICGAAQCKNMHQINVKRIEGQNKLEVGSCRHQGRAVVERHISKNMHQNNVKQIEGQNKLPFVLNQDPLAEKR